MSDPVVVNDDGAVRLIRLNRPEKKNALTQPMYAAITQALRDGRIGREPLETTNTFSPTRSATR